MSNPRPANEQPMVAFGLRIVLFGFVFLVAYVAAIAFAVNAGPDGIRGLRFTNIPYEAPTFGGQTSLMLEEIETVSDVDVLWIGSSHAYRTFDPRFFDLRNVKTFNMGTTAQTPLNTYFLLHEYLEIVRPKSIVLEVYWNVLTWDGVESTMDIVANSEPASWMLRMAIATRDVRAVNAFVRRLLDLRRPEIERVQPNLFVGDTYITRGFVEKASDFSGNRSWPRGDLLVQVRQLEYLERSIAFVTSVGLPIALVTQPLPSSTFAAITNRAELHREVDEIADRYGITYVDYNGLIDLDDTDDYFDSHHLNQNGLETFLPVVYETLVDLGFIPQP